MRKLNKISMVLGALILNQSFGVIALAQQESWPRVIFSQNLSPSFERALKVKAQATNFSFVRDVKPLECRHLNFRVEENFRSLSLLKIDTDDSSFFTLSSKLLANWNEIWGKDLGTVEAQFKWPSGLNSENFNSSFKAFVVHGFSELSSSDFKLLELKQIKLDQSPDLLTVKASFNYMDLCRARSLNIYVFPGCRLSSPSQMGECLTKDALNFEVGLVENERDEDLEQRRK